MADIQELRDEIVSTIYPNGIGAIKAASHQALLLKMADKIGDNAYRIERLNSGQLTLVSEEEQIAFPSENKLESFFASNGDSEYHPSTYFDLYYTQVDAECACRYELGSYDAEQIAAISVSDNLPALDIPYKSITAQEANKTGVFAANKGQYIVFCVAKGQEAYVPQVWAEKRTEFNIVEEIEKLATKEELTTLQTEVINNEEVTAAAINDLNARIGAAADTAYVDNAISQAITSTLNTEV